jgi:gliding motility-associated-like protein
VVVLNLIVKPLAINRIDTSICWNEQIAIGNQSFNATGNYTIKIPRQGNCDSVVLLSLTVYTAPVFEVKVDSQLVYSGSTVQLSVNPILQDVGYEWSPAGQVSDANSPSPTAQITEDIWFYVSITTDLGCVKTDSILVEIRKTACDIDEIYLPNAFTPNGDKKNDVYYVRSNVDFDEMKLTIFDRWGEMVFETIDQKNGWDGTINGKPALVDTYGYILEAKCSEETITRKGKIVLIR